MKFQLLEKDGTDKVGSHRIGSVVYRAGDIVESNVRLDQIFRNKFVKVDDATPVSTGEEVNRPGVHRPNIPKPAAVMVKGAGERDASAPAVSVKSAKASQSQKSKHGADVTDEFPDAELASLKVYHDVKEDRYVVVEPQSDEVLKKAKSEKPIQKFLAEQLG